MKPSVYLETTIPSYLTAWPSRDLIKAARQQTTQAWWKERRSDFALYISGIVLDEAGAGDSEAAAARLKSIEGLPLLSLTPEVVALAEALVQEGPLPEKAASDAFHIALAAVGSMDYLLTWNCAHIANAEIQKQVRDLCRSREYELPVICTPDELLGI